MQSSECTLWRGLVSGFLVDVVSNDMLSPIIETRAHQSTASFEWFLCASLDSPDRYSRAEVRKQRTQRSTPHVQTVLYSIHIHNDNVVRVWVLPHCVKQDKLSLSHRQYDQILTLPPQRSIWLLSPVSPNSYLFILFTRIGVAILHSLRRNIFNLSEIKLWFLTIASRNPHSMK